MYRLAYSGATGGENVTMLRNVWIGAVAMSFALAVPSVASARGGYHSGGLHSGLHGRTGFGWRPGYYGYGPYYGFGYGYPSIYRYEELGGCRIANQRVRTAKGWRVRRVDVCE